MTNAFVLQYLDDAIGQFHSLKDLADRAMAQINDEDLTTALDVEANSIAVLMKHMTGSMRARWTSFPTSAEGQPERRRDSEFMIEGGDIRSVLLDQWEASWQLLFAALERLTPEDMTKAVHIRGKSVSVIGAINRQLTHYAYHVGQIVFLAKHFQSSAWQSLSIPRGKSEEFIAAAQQSHEA